MESTVFHSFVQETDEPTVIDHSVFGEFLPIGGKQLAVFSGKCVRFYRFNPYALLPSYGLVKQTGSWIQKTRMECMCSMKLLQPVDSVAVVRYPDEELDSILLAFEEARVSVITMHAPTWTMKTLHLHTIEEEFLRTGHPTDVYTPLVAVDTENRCSVILGYDQYVAVMPHVGSDHSPFTFELKEVDLRIENIIDVCFLHDFDQPTMLILFEPHQATVGRATLRQDTVSVVGISLNLKDRSYAAVWTVNGLPMDLSQFVPIPSPVGGVLLIGENCLVYLSQSAPDVGVSLNIFNKDFTKFPLTDRSEYQLQLTVARAAVLSPTEIMLVNGNGQAFLVMLTADLNHAVHDIHIKQISGEFAIPRTLTVAWDGYVFLGSRLFDSMLLYVAKKTTEESFNTSNAEQLDDELDDELEDEDAFLYESLSLPIKRTKRKLPEAEQSSATNDFIKKSKLSNHEKPKVKTEEVKKEDVELEAFERDETDLEEGDDSVQKSEEVGDDQEADEEDEDVVIREKVPLDEAPFQALIVDTLPNIGPIKVTQPALPDLHPSFQQKRRMDPVFDTIGACGHGKAGSINFFQRSVRPTSVITCSIDGALQVFTVGRQEDGSHMYLLVAKDTSTGVLEITTGELMDCTLPIFNTNETTIAAGDLLDEAVVAQVTPSGFTLVAHSDTVQIVNLNINFPVVSASIVDRYIAMLTQNGRLFLYEVKLNGGSIEAKFIETKRFLHKEDLSITALCIYRDISGLTHFCKPSSGEPQSSGIAANYSSVESAEPCSSPEHEEPPAEVDEDDFDFLYATKPEEPVPDASAQAAAKNKKHAFKDENLPLGAFVRNPDSIEPKHFLFVTTETSSLQIYLLPSLEIVFNSQKLSNQPNVLKHKNSKRDAYEDAVIGNDYAEMKETQGGRPEDLVVELVVTGMGYNQGRPVLSLLIDDTVLLYEMFAHDDNVEGSLAIRFRKLPNIVVPRMSKFSNSDGKSPVEAIKGQDRYRTRLFPFERVGNMTYGLFVGGGFPTWFFMQRGDIRQHSMTIDGPVHAFSAFNSPVCPHGYIYLNQKTNLTRICCLSDSYDYDMSYPVRRIPMGESIHRVQYVLQNDLLAIVGSKKKTTNKYCVLLNDEKVIETVKREIYPEIESFSIKLFSFEDYKVVPSSEIEFEEFEAVTACEEVLLSSESTLTGLKNYIAVGTSGSYGEEVVVRGRVVLYEVIEVVPEPGFPTSKNKLKLIFDKEQKGSVSSVCSCNGYLLTGIGAKVFIWQFRDNALHGISFLDLSYCVHHLTSFRSLALAVDTNRSVSLIRYQEQYKALSLASRDHRTDIPSPLSAEFLFDHKRSGIVMSDESGALSFFTYSPHLIESHGGEKLILNGYIQLGTRVNSFIRAKPRSNDPMVDRQKEQSKIMKLDFATLDGSFGVVKPISEKLGRRLYYLQSEIITKLGSLAGLNGRTARSITVSKLQGNVAATVGNNVADGRICMEFLLLSQTERNEIARGVGCSKYNIMDDLIELQRLITQH